MRQISALLVLSLGGPTVLTAQLLVPVNSPAGKDPGPSRGVAWGDVDGDGLPELYVARSRGVRNMLYRNRGGNLVPMPESPASIDAGDSEGATFIDFDNDGDLDLHVVARSGGSGLLLENDGSGKFTRRRSPIAPDSMSASMGCWADADRDGDLDVFLVGYRAGRNQLFRNDHGEFTVVPLPAWAEGAGDGRACGWGDPDGDGLPDLAVAVAMRPNLLLLNRGGFRFVRGTLPLLERDSAYSYGVSWPDANQDGRQDLFIANFSGTNRLYLNLGSGLWEMSPDGAVLETAASKGHAWSDVDLDGDLDLYLGSGTPEPGQRNILYRREGAAWVADSALYADTSAAVAWGDLDGDGDLDHYVANWGSAGSVGRLYRNTAADSARGDHWIAIELQGTRSNRQGIGVHVAVWGNGPDVAWQHRWLDANTGYAGANQPIIHFGIPSGAVDSVVIRWPSGQVDRHGRMAGGRRYRAIEGRTFDVVMTCPVCR